MSKLGQLFVAASLSLFAFACGSGVGSDDLKKPDADLAVCAAPASVKYECPGGSCPDVLGCNWCACNLGGGGGWACNLKACGPVQADAGAAPGACATDGDCGGGKACRFRAGCGASSGECVAATDNFYFECSSPPTAITACLCNGTSKQLALDCNGFREAFKNLGPCN